MPSAFLRKPAFWIVQLIASGLCVFTVFRYFGDAFSVLDLDVRMSRDQAIGEARRIVDDQKLSSVKLTESAASFGGDSAAQTFIELEGGGKPALKPLLGSGDAHDQFTLYKWRVRLYSEGVEREVLIAFTPDGRPSGFFSKLPEAEPGPALSADAARTIAVDSATRDWAVDFARYRPLTASAVTRPGKRIDHEFIYEHKLEGAPAIGEGRLRLRMVVSGDRLTHLQRFIFVPEAFARRYETLRSANNTIAAFASVGAGLIYGLGGCLIGLIWLMRRHAVRWGPSAKWAAVVAVLIGGAGLAAIPASWLDYDTATSASTHLITRIGGAVVGAVVTWLLLTVVFATAEGLGRLAFGSHPQLWRTWRTPSATSRAVWGRTLAGYAWIGFDLAFIAAFYFLVQRYLGWWSPSDALIDPNILGAPQPWIPPVAMSLQAGMMEEALFRAVPLAGAALLGRHFGRERLFIVVALVVQAIIFGCAHANYPGQPAYARPVELFLPSLVWGLVYLRYGLLPGILFHFGFDLVLMSIPLFVTDVPGIGFDRAMVIAILAIPIAVLVVQRLRAGRLIDLPDNERNAAAPRSDPRSEPMSRATDEAVLGVIDASVLASAGAVASTDASPRASTSASTPSGTRIDLALLIIFALVGAIGLTIKLTKPYDAPGLVVSRDQALAIAERALTARGVTLDARWQRSVKAIAVTDPSVTRFVWREGGESLYARLIGNVLPPPHWEVRFARFDGDVATRESWRVVIVDDRAAPDGIRVIEHDIPEGAPGKRLAEADARVIALRAIDEWLHLPASALKPVSAEAIEKPARVDWVFVYANPQVKLPAGGEARIVTEVDGDQVVSLGRTLFVPDAWTRDERHRNESLLIPRALLGLIALAFVIGVLVSTVRHLAHGEASRRAAWVGGALTVVAVLVGGLLDLNASQFGFSIAQPFDDQMLRVYLKWLGAAAAAGLFAALFTTVGVRIASRAENRRPAWETRRRTWATAIALALLIAGIGGIVGLIGASIEARVNARVPAIGNADSFVPLLSSFVAGLDWVAAASVALIVAGLLSSRRRWIEAVIALGFVLAALLGAAIVPESRWPSIVAAAIGGALAWWIYWRYVRDRAWIVAPLVWCLSLLSLLPALLYCAYPGARTGAIASAFALALTYAIWRWLLRDDLAKTTV